MALTPDAKASQDGLKQLLQKHRAANDENLRSRREVWDRHIDSLQSKEEVDRLFKSLGSDAVPW
jgi:hypothetical protein